MARRREHRPTSHVSRHVTVMAAILASILVPVSMIAQTLDFSGTWTLDRSQGTAGGSGFPTRLVVKQDAKILHVEEHVGNGVSFVQYGLVGQSRNNLRIAGFGGFGEDVFTARYTSRWEGARLVTSIGFTDERGYGVTHRSQRYQEVRFLRPDGAMVVETHAIDRGVRPISGRNPRGTAVYTRTDR